MKRSRFASPFAARIQRGLADILVVAIDKHKSNDERNSLVADGKALLEADTGFSRAHLDALPADQAIDLLDTVIQLRMWHEPVGAAFLWPYHTKSEPLRTIRLLTDRPDMDRARRARLMRLATLRSLDSYFPQGPQQPTLREPRWSGLRERGNVRAHHADVRPGVAVDVSARAAIAEAERPGGSCSLEALRRTSESAPAGMVRPSAPRVRAGSCPRSVGSSPRRRSGSPPARPRRCRRRRSPRDS